ncbi:MAG TPA: twin-arginine translocase TatA/TatE family subunit [Verrucomicrobiae bacterium]|nr:twin-arginine translocase TatA/TatE family subunit [Verrucomicrobiae bacterium]
MNAMFGFLAVGGWQVVLVLAVVLILFGGKKMPELARGLGQSIKEFKKATREASDDISKAIEDDPTHRPPPANTQAQKEKDPVAKA